MGLRYLFIASLLLLFSACGESGGLKKHIIAKIPEASGICFHRQRKTLYAVSDRGSVYELSTEGKILHKRHIGKYDLEGITCDPGSGMLFAIAEGKDNILILDPKNLKLQKEVSVIRSFLDKKILLKDAKNGLEGITTDGKGLIYLSNQSAHTYPHKDPSVIVVIKTNDLRLNKAPIYTLIDPQKIDIAGLAYQNGYLYMVSDTKNRLYRYNLQKQKIDLEKKLPKFAQEGIAFDDFGYIYFANDKGSILKYKAKKFGIF